MIKSIIKSRIMMMSRRRSAMKQQKQLRLVFGVHDYYHVLIIIQLLVLLFCTTDCNCIGNWNSGKKAVAAASSSSHQQQQQQNNSKNENDVERGEEGGGGENNNVNSSKKTTVVSSTTPGSTSTISDDDEDDHDNVDIDVDMNKTYLDLFGESAKEFLTKKRNIKIIMNKKSFNIPENNNTDDDQKNCQWDWKYIRCEPFCDCSFQYKLPNDLFHLGKSSCRNRNNRKHENENENENEIKKESKDGRLYRTYCSSNNIDSDSDSSNDDGDNNNTNEESNVPSSSRRTRTRTPPPSIQIQIPQVPKIPSPVPIITLYVQSIWKIIQNKSDIVIDQATNEFDIVHEKLQNIVCQDLKIRCDTNTNTNVNTDTNTGTKTTDSNNKNNNKQNSSTSSTSYSPIITMVAWQERLLCQDIIRECVIIDDDEE